MRRFASAGGELTYLDEGEGEVVVLLHGWPTSSFLWRRLTPLLAARFRVLVPDLAGDSIAAQAAGVRELLTHLGVERFAAIGHSYGGGVAQLLALDVAGLDAMLLLDSVAFDVAPPADLDPRTFLERGSVEFASLSATDLAGYLDAAAATPPPQLGDALLGHEAELAAWKFPVMLLWGEDDPFVPMAVAERLNDAIPASTLGVVPESGHFLLDDAFDSIGVLIAEYLRSRYLGAPHGHEGIVMLQLEQRPPWVDLALLEQDDDEPATPDPDDQEVGPNR